MRSLEGLQLGGGTLRTGLGRPPRLGASGAERSEAGVLGTTKEVLVIIAFLVFNSDFLGFPILVLGFIIDFVGFLLGFLS